MQEKAMVSDALSSINSGLKTYTDMISQTENMELRNALVQMRNETEQAQMELYQIAKNKNYYQPSAQASQNEIQNLKSVFTGSTPGSANQSMPGSSMMGGSMPGSSGVTSGIGSGMSSGMGSGMSSGMGNGMTTGIGTGNMGNSGIPVGSGVGSSMK